jgi:hypothetical protein
MKIEDLKIGDKLIFNVDVKCDCVKEKCFLPEYQECEINGIERNQIFLKLEKENFVGLKSLLVAKDRFQKLLDNNLVVVENEYKNHAEIYEIDGKPFLKLGFNKVMQGRNIFVEIPALDLLSMDFNIENVY